MNIKYREYLLSKEWSRFRKKVLETRKFCQNCGISLKKTKANIHHINYKNIFKETFSDVLALCQNCHLTSHKKPKWVKAKKSRSDMNFTKASKESLSGTYFNIKSSEVRSCFYCGKSHPIFYKNLKSGLRLAMVCPESKPRTKFLPMEEGLNIPILG